MSSGILGQPSPDFVEEERLRSRINDLRDEIAARAAELEELRASVSVFEVRFDARIGVLIIELDRLSVQIAAYERRIAALSGPAENWTRIEDDIRNEFQGEWERIAAEDQEAHESTRRVATLPPEPSESTKAELRRLYLMLARNYHPDLAKCDEERASHEDAMRRINAAYEDLDLDTLQRLRDELPEKDGELPGTTNSARIAWAVAQIGRLEQTLANLHADIARLKTVDKYRMYERVLADPTLLDRLESSYRQEIDASRKRLESLIDEYRRTAVHLLMERCD